MKTFGDCPHCTHAVQYPDGAMRCELDECKPKVGRFRLWVNPKFEVVKARKPRKKK